MLNLLLFFVHFADVDWAGDPSDRRSTTGYCFLLVAIASKNPINGGGEIFFDKAAIPSPLPFRMIVTMPASLVFKHGPVVNCLKLVGV